MSDAITRLNTPQLWANHEYFLKICIHIQLLITSILIQVNSILIYNYCHKLNNTNC